MEPRKHWSGMEINNNFSFFLFYMSMMIKKVIVTYLLLWIKNDYNKNVTYVMLTVSNVHIHMLFKKDNMTISRICRNETISSKIIFSNVRKVYWSGIFYHFRPYLPPHAKICIQTLNQWKKLCPLRVLHTIHFVPCWFTMFTIYLTHTYEVS